jgi:hypothetical protein
MLSAEPLRRLDLMTQGEYHRPNISLQLSKNNVCSLPPIPRPKPVSGERIAPIRCTRLATLAFIEAFLAGKVGVQ